jgi:hypothetical protein
MHDNDGRRKSDVLEVSYRTEGVCRPSARIADNGRDCINELIQHFRRRSNKNRR